MVYKIWKFWCLFNHFGKFLTNLWIFEDLKIGWSFLLFFYEDILSCDLCLDQWFLLKKYKNELWLNDRDIMSITKRNVLCSTWVVETWGSNTQKDSKRLKNTDMSFLAVTRHFNSRRLKKAELDSKFQCGVSLWYLTKKIAKIKKIYVKLFLSQIKPWKWS